MKKSLFILTTVLTILYNTNSGNILSPFPHPYISEKISSKKNDTIGDLIHHYQLVIMSPELDAHQIKATLHNTLCNELIDALHNNQYDLAFFIVSQCPIDFNHHRIISLHMRETQSLRTEIFSHHPSREHMQEFGKLLYFMMQKCGLRPPKHH